MSDNTLVSASTSGVETVGTVAEGGTVSSTQSANTIPNVTSGSADLAPRDVVEVPAREPRPAIDLSRDDNAIVQQSASLNNIDAPSPEYMWAMLHECLRVCAVLVQGSLRSHPELENLVHITNIPPLTKGGDSINL
jgi:hypothetical protein